MMTAVTPLRASDWQLQESANASLDYVDNPRLVPDTTLDDERLIASAAGSLQRNSEIGALQIAPQVSTTRYSSSQELDNTAGSLALSWQHAGQRGNWFANAQGAVDSTLTTELGLSGISDVNRQRQSLVSSAGGSWNLSELTQLGVQLSGNRVHYRDASGTGLSSYSYGSITVDPSWAVGQLSRLTVQGEYDVLDSDNVAQTQRSYNGTIGFSHQAGERDHWHLSGGASGSAVGTITTRGWVLDAGVTRTGLRGSLSASAQRRISPVGNGLLERTDSMSVDAQRQLTEHASLSTAIRFVHSANTYGSLFGYRYVAYPGSVYARILAEWNWSFSPHWSTALRLGSSGADQDSSGSNPWAKGWDTSLAIFWHADQQ